MTVAATCVALAPVIARAEAPATTVQYQVMVSTGLAARKPFEAWFVFDRSSDPRVSGYAVPAGATVRFTFPHAFTPEPHGVLDGALISWAQGAVPAKFSLAVDPNDPRTVVLRFVEPVVPAGPDHPGLKAIHLRATEINPAKPGAYPIAVRFVDAGPLSGTTTAVAHIAAKPVPNVAAYNQLHQNKDEDWQHVKPGEEAPLPIDFLITLPNAARSSLSLRAKDDHDLAILSDGKPIGSITTKGVPVTLAPKPFGPGFARLGIIELRAKAGPTPGTAEIVAALDGGTRYVIHLVVEGR
ncbi:MAG: hypothetical protein KGJ66_15240 [Alphaproteobacteria bacterium]|nr:hypothetical protein [Alphaproteobacteria bacterium]